MKLRLTLFVIITFILSYATQAQVAVNNTLSVQQLVEEYLIGDGVQVTNITINGQPAGTVNNQAGLYTGPSNYIGFDQGVVMTTGNANIVTGGIGGGLTHPIQNDPDLMAISGQNIYDAIIIEFDFLATTDSIKFNYSFASKEYPGYTCTVKNDAFGFFLSGAGITGPYSNNSKNIALIPGTDVEVAINTVNAGYPGTYGTASICEQANPDWIEHSQYFVSNAGTPSGDVQFPGMTQTFTARSAVQCGEWYHIKLAIGDADDIALDSGVFLEAGSFAAFGEVFLSVAPQIGGSSVTNPLYDSVLVAGCSEAYIELTRPGGMPTDSVFVEFSGTAIQEDPNNPILGADYLLGENDTLFFFPEGLDTISFTITTIWDEIPDENEYLTITIFYKDGCGETKSDSITIYFVDPYSLGSTAENVIVTCPADQVLISAEFMDGIEPYIYDWGEYGHGEDVTSVLVDVPADSAYYYVSMTDVCSFEERIDSVLVVNNIPDPLRAVVDPFMDPKCPNEPLDLHASIQDGNGEYHIVWEDGKGGTYHQEDITISGINKTVFFNPEPIGFTDVLPVYLTVTDTCGTVVIDTIHINYPFIAPLKASFNPLTDHCPSEPIVIKANVDNGQSDFVYGWAISNGSFGDGADPNADHIHVVPAPGTNEYTLSVSDYCGRTGTDYQYGDQLTRSGFDIYTDSLRVIDLNNIMNVITPNGDQKNDFFVVSGVHKFDDSRLEVYDRWGRMIYQTDNYRAGEMTSKKPDGAFDADGFEDGTYFYIINVNSGECVQSGTIEVLRGNN